MKYIYCTILLIFAHLSLLGCFFPESLSPEDYKAALQDLKDRRAIQKIDTLFASGTATQESIKEINKEPFYLAFFYFKPEWIDPLTKLGFYLSTPLAYHLATELAEYRRWVVHMLKNKADPFWVKRKDIFRALLIHCKNLTLSEKLIKEFEKADLPITPYRSSMRAFLMATHRRTGALSPAKSLPIWVIKEIDKWVPFGLIMRDLW